MLSGGKAPPGKGFNMYHDSTYRVPYADTDQMGVVYYANYLVYFERSRTEMLRSVGLPYCELEKRGLIMPVIEANCRYFAPAHYDELLTFRSYVLEYSRVKLKVGTDILRDGDILVSGFVMLGCVGLDRKPLRMPPELSAACATLTWNKETL